MKEKQKAIEDMIKKENLAKQNVAEFMKEQEKNRQEFEKEIHEKSKI